MLKWLKELDRILRGDATRMEELWKAELRIPVLGLSVVILALAVFYAVCLDFYAMFRPDGRLYLQAFMLGCGVEDLFPLAGFGKIYNWVKAIAVHALIEVLPPMMAMSLQCSRLACQIQPKPSLPR